MTNKKLTEAEIPQTLANALHEIVATRLHLIQVLNLLTGSIDYDIPAEELEAIIETQLPALEQAIGNALTSFHIALATDEASMGIDFGCKTDDSESASDNQTTKPTKINFDDEQKL